MSLQSLFSTSFRWVSLLFALLCLFSAAQTLLFIQNSTIVEAEVTGYREVENYAPFGLFRAEDSVHFFVEAEYRTQSGGRLYTITASRGGAGESHDIGESILVRYRNRAPERARMNTPTGLWGRAGVFAVLAAIFGALSLIAPFAFRLGNQGDQGRG